MAGVMRLSLEAIRNDLMVPQARTGTGFGLALRYERMPGAPVLKIEAGLGARYALASLGAGVVFDHGLRIRDTFEIFASDWHVGLGPAFGWETDIAYLESRDDAQAYWLTDRWLGFTTSMWHAVAERWRFEVELEMMVVAVQSLPGGKRGNPTLGLDARSFFRVPERDQHFAWIGDTQRLRLGIDLWRPYLEGGHASGWTAGIELRVLHAAYPESLTLFEVGLHVRYLWGLH